MLEELHDGTSKPLKVKTVVRRPNNGEPQLREFVLKRAGGEGGRTRTAHIVSEFTAMAMYARAGLKVPAAALYTVKASCANLVLQLAPAASPQAICCTASALPCCACCAHVC